MILSKPSLRPYEVLVGAINIIGERSGGRLVTANYADIGILTEKYMHYTGIGIAEERDRFFHINAIVVEEQPWLVGVLSPNFRKKDDNAYIYGFQYNWERLFLRNPRTKAPRLMPSRAADSTFDMQEAFSYDSAFVVSSAGILEPAENMNCAYVSSANLSQIVENETRLEEGKIKYTPRTPKLLAPIVFAAFVKKRETCRPGSE